MSAYEPGTVAIATVRGVPNVRIMWRDVESGYLAGWWTSRGAVYADSKDVTDIRPLVVLDPSDYEQSEVLAKTLVEAMYAAGDRHSAANGVHPATVAAALHNMTRPPRIPEPGIWGVVSARVDNGRSSHAWFVRRMTDGEADWQDGASDYWAWSDLIDPTLVRDGIKDDQ